MPGDETGTGPRLTRKDAMKPNQANITTRGSRAATVSAWALRHPFLAIFLVSLTAVVINFHPIIFCGKSYVAPVDPGIGVAYYWWPPLPGMKAKPPIGCHGSDTAATLIWGIPVGFIEYRSLVEHGEIPLWNRYSHAGDTLIGQGISMLGDPLHLIVIAGHSSSTAWDLKFFTAKLLFCIGFGLLLRRLSGSLGLSLLYSALAAYCGAFFYINSHPVFFVFSYAPWVLLSALAMLDLKSAHHLRWGLVWLVANVGCFNAGHVEVAVILIGGCNLAAVACALMSNHRFPDLIKVLGRMTVATILFLGLTAPVWMSFLGALEGSYSAHTEIRVGQLRFASLMGVFDDIFYLRLLKDESSSAYAPGASLLVMVGCFLSALRWRQLKHHPFFLVNSAAILLWGGCIFGGVPPRILGAIPFLNHVGHLYTDFSYLLILHLTIQSAYGFKCLATEENFNRTAMDFAGVGIVFAGLLVLFCLGITHHPIPWNYVLTAGIGAFGAPLLFVFLKTRYHAVSVPGWTAIIILGFIAHFRFGPYAVGNPDLLMLLESRVEPNGASPAIDKIKLDRSGPYRVVGVPWNLYGDYAAVYGLEDIRSCAPLSNQEFINLINNFPGMTLEGTWVMEVGDMARAQPLLNLLNVRYLLCATNVEVQSPGLRVTDRSDFGVVENRDAWPRAFFTDKIVSVASNETFIQYLVENPKQPFIALTPGEIQKQPGLAGLENAKEATVTPATHYQLLPNSTAFDVHASSAGMVCLTEGQAKDFTVKANGKPGQVLTVNQTFKGVYLDRPGDYHIEFVYRPSHWRFSCGLFWAALAGTLVIIVAGRRRCREKAGQSPDAVRQ